MELRDYLAILKRRRWIIASTLIMVVAATAFLTFRATPIYRATALVEVNPASLSSQALLNTFIDPQTRIQTQVETLQSSAVLSVAATELGLVDHKPIRGALAVAPKGNSQIVGVSVEHEDPIIAGQWANAVADAYLEYRRDRALDEVLESSKAIQRRIDNVTTAIAEHDRVLSDLRGEAQRVKAQRDQLARDPSSSTDPDKKQRLATYDRQITDYESGGSEVKSRRDSLVAQRGVLTNQQSSLPSGEEFAAGAGQVIERATTPTAPFKPRKLINLALAFVVGAGLGVAMAFVSDNLDDRVRGAEEIEQITEAPIVGFIPEVKDWATLSGPYVAAVNEPTSGVAEAYRTLRTNLRFLSVERPIRALLVTSSVAEEGKSTTAANLAVAFAQGGTKTILVAADLRRPTVHKMFGVDNSIGLVDMLDPSVPVEKALQDPGVENFRLLSGGGLPPNPTEIVASTRFAHIMDELKAVSEMIVLDSPPILGLTEASALATRVDGVLLVVDLKKATRKSLTHAVTQLKRAGGRLVGVALNGVGQREDYGYYYNQYYYDYNQLSE